jgi:hypothetical protein
MSGINLRVVFHLGGAIATQRIIEFSISPVIQFERENTSYVHCTSICGDRRSMALNFHQNQIPLRGRKDRFAAEDVPAKAPFWRVPSLGNEYRSPYQR